MENDVTLVAAALSGGPEMFGPIIERYQDVVFAVALARLGNFHDAEDIAQEVFIEAFDHLGKLGDPSRLGTWLRSIAVHRCIDHLRLRRGNISLDEIAEQVEDRESNPHIRIEYEELRVQVIEAIGRLSNKQRETTTLFYINGYSQEEIARIQEVPIGTVRRRLHDARKTLKEEMIRVVEDVLKSEAPKDDFGEKVYDILSRYHRPLVSLEEWEEAASRIQEIGIAGVDGFVKALKSPYFQTRRFAVRILPSCVQNQEVVEELLKKSLADTNKEVRRAAFRSLAEVMQGDNDKRKELATCLVKLLKDPSWRIRWYVAWWLADYDCAKYIQLEQIVEVFLEEKDRKFGRI